MLTAGEKCCIIRDYFVLSKFLSNGVVAASSQSTLRTARGQVLNKEKVEFHHIRVSHCAITIPSIAQSTPLQATAVPTPVVDVSDSMQELAAVGLRSTTPSAIGIPALENSS